MPDLLWRGPRLRRLAGALLAPKLKAVALADDLLAFLEVGLAAIRTPLAFRLLTRLALLWVGGLDLGITLPQPGHDGSAGAGVVLVGSLALRMALPCIWRLIE
jgi:hypothetical protein